jgi:hypothetical protein
MRTPHETAASQDRDRLVADVRRGLDAISRLKALDETLRTQHHTMVTHDRRSIIGDAEPVDLVVAHMREGIDRLSQRWANEHRSLIVEAFTARLRESRGDGRVSVSPPRGRFDIASSSTLLDTLCGLVPEMVKEALEDIIRSTPYKSGLPLDDRLPALRQLEEAIRAIEDQHTALVDEASAVDPPVVLKLLTPVRDRREEERRQSLAASRESEQRTELEHRVNERHRRTGPSSYIAGATAHRQTRDTL